MTNLLLGPPGLHWEANGFNHQHEVNKDKTMSENLNLGLKPELIITLYILDFKQNLSSKLQFSTTTPTVEASNYIKYYLD